MVCPRLLNPILSQGLESVLRARVTPEVISQAKNLLSSAELEQKPRKSPGSAATCQKIKKGDYDSQLTVNFPKILGVPSQLYFRCGEKDKWRIFS